MVKETGRLLPSEYLQRGWCQHSLHDGNGNMCLVGAILAWDTGAPRWTWPQTPAFIEFTEALDLGVEGGSVAWNNARERTQAEVVARAKMVEVKLGLRETDVLVEPEPVVERLRDGLVEELELVGVGD